MYLKFKCLINLQAHYLCFHFPPLGAGQQLLTAAPRFPEQENEQYFLFVQYATYDKYICNQCFRPEDIRLMRVHF